jgi:hypothetical protein
MADAASPLLLTAPRGPVLPGALGDHRFACTHPLSQLPELGMGDSVALVRSARLYQDAVWLAESQPGLAWLLLVSAVETAAHHWRQSQDSPVDRLRASKPDLESLLVPIGGEELLQRVAEILADSFGSSRKFLDFLHSFLPSPPPVRPPAYAQLEWEWAALQRSLRRVYTCRSNALHSGIPFPWPMCASPRPVQGAHEEKPLGSAMSALGGIWRIEHAPMLLHVFEYIARHAVLNWWTSMLPPARASTA